MSASLAEFLAAAIIMELTPGPNMAWLALLSAQQGRRTGFMAVAGVTTGLTLLAIAAATGAAALIAAYPVLYEAIRWGGVIFMLYLALEAWRGKRANAGAIRATSFWRGVTVNLLNPKAASVFLLLIPGFAGRSDGAAQTIALLSVIYLAVATMVHLLIVTFAGSFERLLADPRREAVARRVFAAMLAAVAVWIAVSTGRG